MRVSCRTPLFNSSLRIILICLICLLTAAVVPAWGSATLYRGATQLGSVETIKGPMGDCVCIEEVGSFLGFSSSRTGDELLLSRRDTKLRVVMNAGVAWRDVSLISLKGVPFEKNGRCWLDTSSAISLFQGAVGAGANNRLRFAVTGQVNPIPDLISRPSSSTNSTSQPVSPEVPVSPTVKPESPVSRPVQAAPTAPIVIVNNNTGDVDIIEIPEPEMPDFLVLENQNTPVEPVSAKQEQITVTQSQQKQQQSRAPASQVKVSGTAKAQPKVETFQLKNPQERSAHPSLNGGTIQGLRWSTSKHKIRAVVDASDGADPVVQMKNGVIYALFKASQQKTAGIPSPYENVNVSITAVSDGVELAFMAKCDRIEKMVLDSPRRIVFDFYFPENTRIVASKNQTQPAPVALPVLIPSSSPVPAQKTVPKPTPQVKPTAPVTQPKPLTPAETVIQAQTQPQTGNKTPVSAPVSAPTSGGYNRVNKRKLVAVDPGHGGKDPGTSGNGIVEKNINLAIGLELEKALKSKGFDVIMTRRTDVYLKLQERTDIANNANADVFVSVHVNALPSSKTASGFEIYIMALPTDKDAMNLAKIENREYVEGHSGENAASDKRTELLLQILGDMQQNNKINESTDLAETLFTSGKQNGIPMRRVAQAPFFVLRGAAMPAVLLETGFATNATEAKLLAHSAYQQRIAQAMAVGIANYLK